MVGEMKQYLATQQKKTQTLKKLEYHCQDYHKLTQILNDYIESD
jgi:predicted small metal-binding protein